MRGNKGKNVMIGRQNVIAALLCLGGIVFNVVLNEIVLAFDLPIYLDSVGTIAVAACGGYLPGAIVGFFTNVVRSIQTPSSIFYGVANVLIALFAALVSKKGWFKNKLGIFKSILLFSLIGGGVGAVIPWYMDGISFESDSLSGILYGTGYFNVPLSHIFSSLIIDFLDKTITVLMVVAMLRVIPEKFFAYCNFSMWMQNPDSVGDTVAGIKNKAYTRKMSIRGKVLLILGISLGIVAVVAAVISMNVFHKTITNENMKISRGATKLAAGVIDGDRIDEYLESKGRAEGYDKTKAMLTDILNTSENIAYLYVYKIEENGCRVVFDIDTNGVSADPVGRLIPFDEEFSQYVPALLRGDEIEPMIVRDSYGYLLTSYYPVYDSNKKTVCYVGVDVDMDRLEGEEKSFLMELISVFAGFFLLLCSFVMWLTDYNIIYPLRAVTASAEMNSFMDNSQENLDDSVRKIRSINVRTGDELENLYNSFCRMTLNQSEQMRSIKRLSESTSKMQDGLIVTMADMVENRDSDTGAHIQKTAAYVRIIVEGLKKHGYYAEKITPKFISDVVRSAPLHDVGKINISDEVLNKPGKLTAEEFEIMKTHTTAGKHIIERVISTVQGDSYLKEARNMAAYHHERWDGKGYPEGLHGEVIPLAARIMAVADVFDALTSPRVYKPAFPLEKALSIIEEGKGTQFDPKCVEVFFDAMDEVKIVLRKYNQTDIT